MLITSEILSCKYCTSSFTPVHFLASCIFCCNTFLMLKWLVMCS
jgi:hypothetical protein